MIILFDFGKNNNLFLVKKGDPYIHTYINTYIYLGNTFELVGSPLFSSEGLQRNVVDPYFYGSIVGLRIKENIQYSFK